jgi:hypothetical protein
MNKLTTLEAIRDNVKPIDWKAELKRLKLAYIERTAPGFYKASGGDTMQIKPYSDRTANGLTTCVCDWIKFNGGGCAADQHNGPDAKDRRANEVDTLRKPPGVCGYTCHH